MAVRAHGAKIGDRVNLVLFADFGERSQVVNVHNPIGDFSVSRTEREAANLAIRPIPLDAFFAGVPVPLIRIDEDVNHGAFANYFSFSQTRNGPVAISTPSPLPLEMLEQPPPRLVLYGPSLAKPIDHIASDELQGFLAAPFSLCVLDQLPPVVIVQKPLDNLIAGDKLLVVATSDGGSDDREGFNEREGRVFHGYSRLLGMVPVAP
jgi:hypothetical protein